MKKQIKDVIKYITIKGKKVAVSAALLAMLGANVACATVPKDYKVEKKFSIHKDASDPEHEKEQKYTNVLIKRGKENLKHLDVEELQFMYDVACHDIIIMSRYNNDIQRLWQDLVKWVNGEIAINPTEYTYEEDKQLMEISKEKCGRDDGYTLENNKLVCPSNSKER